MISSGLTEDVAVKTETVTEAKSFFKDGFYNCNKCVKKVKRQDNFKRHYFNAHGLIYRSKNVTTNCRNVCIYPECSNTYYHKSKMLHHLEKDHKIDVKSEKKTFNSFESFMEWKAEEENKNFVSFVKRDERESAKFTFQSSYVCKNDGIIQNQNDVQNIICPARMLVKKFIRTGSITVTYIKSHNHVINTTDVKNHPIPSIIKDIIINKLKQQKTVDEIYSELHQEATIDNDMFSLKKILVKKQQIYYLQQKLEISSEIATRIPSVATNISFILRLNQLDAECSDYNSILLSQNYEQGSNCDSNVIFAFQTYHQNQLFQKFCATILFFEEILPTSNMPYNILTLKVIDESDYCCNVAHLVCTVWNEEIAKAFFREISARCKSNLKITTVMTSLLQRNTAAFKYIFGDNVNFIYSKWHLHQLFFSKLLTDYPQEEDLRHQVYFTLCALIEEVDQIQFKSIMTEFINSYQAKCPNFIQFTSENYFNTPEKWAVSYRHVYLHNIDHLMHLNILSEQLKAEISYTNSNRTLDGTLHTILNINQSNWLKKQYGFIDNEHFKEHDESLTIPDSNVHKISETQWIVKSNESCKYEVNWNSDKCTEHFCKNRCLKLICFSLCVHLYVCNCEKARKQVICSHIHKVHSLETGVYSFQNITVTQDENIIEPKKFQLYVPVPLQKRSNREENFHKCLENLRNIEEVLKHKKEKYSEEFLRNLNKNLEDILQECK